MADKPEVLEKANRAAATLKPPNKKNGAGREFRKTRKFTVKKLILLIIIAAAVIGGAYGIYKLFFFKEPTQIVTGTTKKDSITTVIEGTATTQPTRFQDLTIPVNGTVKEVFVKQGDQVAVGDKLYTIDTTSLNQDIASVESSIANYQTQLQTYSKNVSNLTIKAPFAGKLIDTASLLAGDSINSNTKIATIVDDSKMKLELYFSNSYLNDIKTGMNAKVSVPQYMTTLDGTVTDVDNVSYVTSEGTICFKVTVTVNNPGSLTKGLSATAAIQAAGTEINPADSGTLDYNKTKAVLAQAGGTITSLNMQDSLKVASGEVLAVISNDDYSNQLSMLQKQIDSATLNLQNLQDELAECSPTATVAGTVIFIRIEAGDSVNSGTTAMAIYNTDTMKIVADISETQNDYITEGMAVTITKSGSSGTPLTGTVTKKSLEATASNGVAYFETTITVESKGALSPGIYVTYSITAAQASNVVLAPIAAIQQTPSGTCLFIKSDTAPAEAVTLADGVVPEGYYAVKVETGLTSNDYVEIKSGAAEGAVVFERYVKKNTTSGSDQTSQTSDNGSSSFSGQFPNNGSFPGGSFPGGGPGSN